VGAYLAFHHQVFHAQTALKTHTTELDAFSGLSSNVEFTPQQNELIVQDAQIEKAASFQILNWMMQPIATQHLVQQLRHLLPAPPHFLVLQGFGTGNIAVNHEFLATLDELCSWMCSNFTTQVTFGVLTNVMQLVPGPKLQKLSLMMP
jgi:L-asparaginase